MNKDRLTYLCHELSRKTGVGFNTILSLFFLESILRLLSVSSFRSHFVFKGGFLLSNIFGIERRTTVDIDMLLMDFPLNHESIAKMLREILEGNPSKINYSIRDISDIKLKDPYSGIRVKILCQLDNIRQVVPLDFATGDVITPYPIVYGFESLFSQEKIEIQAYPLETILAEKLHTIYQRNIANSRSKDFYDIYLISKLKKDEINLNDVDQACRNTFAFRDTKLDYNELILLLDVLKTDTSQTDRWSSFCNKNMIDGQCSFDDVMNECIDLVQELSEVRDE